MRNAYKNLVGRPEGKVPLEEGEEFGFESDDSG
jgi:hypothetical protein